MTFPNPGVTSCGCPDGFVKILKNRNTVTCSAQPPEMMYITLNTTQDMINVISLTPPVSRRQIISIQQAINPPSVDFHWKLELMFYFETENGITSLYSQKWKQNGHIGRNVIIDVGLKGAVKLSVDWIGDSIYWTNNEIGRIEQISIDGRNRRTVTTDCTRPHAIKAMDLKIRRLFRYSTNGKLKLW